MQVTQQHGSIFIAWGNNKKLADEVAESLSEAGYSAEVGAAEPRGRSSFLLGETVFKQLRRSAAVIVLAEMFAESTSTKPNFRPNLLLEWGYAMRHVSANRLMVFLIGASFDDLPADLKGSWAQVIESYRDDKGIENKLLRSRRSMKISKLVISQVRSDESSSQESPFSILRDWERFRYKIEATINGDLVNPINYYRHILPNAIIPLNSNQDDGLVRRLLDSNPALNELPEYTLLSVALKYYRVVRQNRSDKVALLYDLDAQLKSIEETALLTSWARMIRLNFLGLINRKIGYDKLQSAAEYFERATDIINGEQLEDRSATMWRGFVFRNKARVYSELGSTRRINSLLRSSLQAREKTYGSLASSPNTTKDIVDDFFFEYLASSLDAVQYAADKRKLGLEYERARVALLAAVGRRTQPVQTLLAPLRDVAEDRADHQLLTIIDVLEGKQQPKVSGPG